VKDIEREFVTHDFEKKGKTAEAGFADYLSGMEG